MSPKTPIFKPRELVDLLKSHGYQEVTQVGSHPKMRREGIVVIIPIHHGRDLAPGLIAAILRRAGIEIT
jgi:predicted RNA binding protein YcfA (HicA-like mRNA interferase family)